MAKKPIKSIELLPEFLRTDKNSKFLSSTIDQLIQPPKLERLDGFVGSKITPTYISTSDVYISESLSLRRDYQLEPALIVKNSLGKVQQANAIDDLANKIISEGGFNNDFDRLFRSNLYSFDPRIDFDKFVNYQKYYWLPTGPERITITGKQLNSTSTFTVVDNEIQSAWIFSPDGLTEDPTIVLYRGNTYSFSVSSQYKFYIKIAPSLGIDDVYDINVTGNGTQNGVVTIKIDENTPSTLYYASDEEGFVQGKFVIKQATEDAYINIDQEILGKQNYTSGTGLKLSNGMKIKFGGEIFPDTYKDKEYIVEGVGRSIRLVDFSLLTGNDKLSSQVSDDDFDASSFDEYPYDDFKTLPLVPDYLTINRASKDLNPWSRYNRWFHEDLIKIAAEQNNTIAVFPANSRAKRPIIEFVADLQLYNFGSFGIKNVDVIDNDTIDAFSIVEGSGGYYVDGVLLQQGHRVIFNADRDDQVRGKIYEVNFNTLGNFPKVELKLVEDQLVEYASIGVNFGNDNAGKNWWYNGTKWVLAQQHDKINQPPLFDVFDNNGISYSDTRFYDTDFSGSKVFSYEIGTGSPDPVLGFPLAYQNTVSVGSFKFKNYFNTDTISLFRNDQVIEVKTSIAYLKINQSPEVKFVNVWNATEAYEIPILQLISVQQSTSTVELNAIDNPDTTEFDLIVYLNNVKIDSSKWSKLTGPKKCFIEFVEPISEGTNVLFKIFTRALANKNGQYETPTGLTNNPLNGPISSVTLTEMSDHFKTMTDRVPGFAGDTFGSNNSRDIDNISRYGIRLVANENPIVFANFFLGIKENSVIDALQKSADQYNQFKSLLYKRISEIGNINNSIEALDVVMTSLNTDKDLNSPWYYSDMIPYGNDKITRTWDITDSQIKIYPIVNDFNPELLSTRSVLVYLNNVQLILNRDYRFLVDDSSIEIIKDINEGDVLKVEDYNNTLGSYIPPTPTKLGLYPKFTPSIYLDNTYINPVRVIQGHDGSITVAFNDFRDDIILEFEKRVYNNIKSKYNPDILDINKILPGAFRQSDYNLLEINQILQNDFVRWAGFYTIDYIKNDIFDLANPFTWNYYEGYNYDLEKQIQGHWRAVFKFLFDTDRPHTHPWEMLGFSEQPDWWENEYGPSPYTSGNLILWNDLEQGVIKLGERAGIDLNYIRPGLSQILPVDQFGNLVDPSIIVSNTTPYNIRQSWKFGDQGPAETAWRRSSYWPFAVQRLLALTYPATYCSLLYDTSRTVKNLAEQWTYGNSNEQLDLRKLIVAGHQGALTSGYSAYVSEIGYQRNTNYRTILKNNLQYTDINLFHKVGGFVSKNKLRIIIDAIEPNSTNPGSLLPAENYNLILNTSTPIKSANISGIIIQKTNGRFVINGYDRNNPYFTILTSSRNSSTPTVTVGGVSESYVVWTSGETVSETGLSTVDTTTAESIPSGPFYKSGQIVLFNQIFYRVVTSHKSGSSFNSSYFVRLPSLPVRNGATVQKAGFFNKVGTQIPYGTEFNTIQEVYDLIVGYGKWLESQGFMFDEYNNTLDEIVNWDLSAKEFLFWTTQNWADNNIITLSPFANKIKYTLPQSVVDNVFNNFYEYSILKADGLPISQKKLNVFRNDGICTIETFDTTDGIYFAQIISVQKEHALVFDNKTVFADTIFDIQTGYRQKRVRLIGFRTGEWNGDYFSPGFIFDEAIVNDWQKYTTYLYGDTVRYNGNFYSAKQNVVAASTFDFNSWVLLNEKPLPDLIPNFEYKINQFEDFYSLDIDNFDDAQQKMSQHLIGYTPRVYLDNVFVNPISQYKFYQGFIKEKGTKNAVKKMAKASIFNLQGEVTYNEEWAFRIGQYGAFTSYEELEVKLKEGTFIENPQVVNFVDLKPNNPVDLIYYSTSTDILIKPDDYNSNQTFVTTSSSLLKLPMAGYVSYEDITATAYNENSLLDIANINQLKTGDVFWLGFKSNGEWDVLRYDLLSARVIGVYVSNPALSITFVTDVFHNLSIGDIITVTRFNDQVNGVYIVRDIPTLNQFTVESTLTTIFNEELLSPGLLHKFNGVRSTNIDSLPDDFTMLKFPVESKFWIDNKDTNGNFDWKVYKKINNFSVQQIKNINALSDQQFGYSVSKKSAGNIILVGAPKFQTIIDYGRVIAYIKTSNSIAPIFGYTLNNTLNQFHSSAEITDFGHSVAYSSNLVAGTDYGILYGGAPSIGNVATTGTILKYASNGASIISAVEAGAVKVSIVDPVDTDESNEIVLLSPQYGSYERFGSTLSVNGVDNNLFVGAPGTKNTGSGSVYFYQTSAPIGITKVTTTSTSGTNILYVDSTATVEVGQNIWVSGLINQVINGIAVSTIYDDGSTKYLILDKNLTVDIPVDSRVKFYNTSTLLTHNNLYTTTNGLVVLFVGTYTATTPVTGDKFGYSIDSSADGNVIVVGAPGGDYIETIVNIGKPSQIKTVNSSVFGSGIRFGESVALSKNGDYLFVGAPDVKNFDDSFGKVAIYTRTGNTYTYSTSISNPVPGAGMNFGMDIVVNDNTNTLVISSIGLNKQVPVAFNNEGTYFDSSSTFFYDVVENFGTAYVYDKVDGSSRFVLSAELTPSDSVGFAGSNFGYSIAIDDRAVYIGAPSIAAASTGTIYYFNKLDVSKQSLDLYKSNDQLVDIDTVQSVRLINAFDETIADYLDIIDPAKGKIAGLAEQELKYKSAYDPAVYSIGTAGVVVDTDTAWLDEHVGELWWDLSTVKYVWYEQGDLTYRKNNWGTIFPGATIDVYEWVKSTYLPSEWSAIADTSSGLTESISGQPKYVDNSSISIKQIYNSVSNNFTNVYYYWVKNKVTVPNVRNRRISSYQVANLIADPIGYGLKFASLISKDAVALSNVAPLLVDDRIHLNLGFDTIKNKNPKHTEWTLLQENTANSMPPVVLEKKLFDSLLGKDSLGNPVPDPLLSDRTRYGIGIRPRQTMFKNRREALRNLIEFTNDILRSNQITGSYNFSNLNAQELPPDEFSREYDLVVEDNEGLNIIETRNLKKAALSCTVLNGKIRSVTIIDPGYGYRSPPLVKISNEGTDAVIETTIDQLGRVNGVIIKNAGNNYSVAPNLIVRPFSVIVLADSSYNNKWTKLEWNQVNNEWDRKQTQKYNTTLYWNYIDWKSDSYNEFIDYSFTVDLVYQLDSLENILPGQYVKVKNIGDGRFIVVEKAAEGQDGNFGKGYNLVFSQNGTIQISEAIWNIKESNLAFDQNNNFDQTLYDQTPDLELGYILAALKNDIFINELKINWNKFFFNAVKYALTEQKLLDWAFKTSFINVINYAGLLDQRPVYKLRSSENYENYIREIKPYHSKIRTFTANHEIYDPSNSFFTDFDNPVYYNSTTDAYESVDSNDNKILELPWRTWDENKTYEIGKVTVGNGGSGYTYPPQVTIQTAPGDTGTGAVARAYILSGSVNKIEVINPGKNYKVAPTVILTGGGSGNLVAAVAYAQLYNGKVRANLIGMKFDRISRSSSIGVRSVTDSFICNGIQNEFVLNWFAEADKTKITVTLNDELILGSSYRVDQFEQNYNGYKKSFTKIVFLDETPLYGQILKITYLKNINLYNAAERILEVYTATSEMPGKDLAQLMTGIEYPGVKVEALPFDYTLRWDISYSPFGKSSYADNIGFYNKSEVTEIANAGTDTLVVSTTTGIVVGQIVNVISAVKPISTSSVFSIQQQLPDTDVKVVEIDTASNRIKFSSTLSVSLVTTSTNVYINNELTTVTNIATVEFWNYDENNYVLDTVVTGGTWNTLTNNLSGALGINPEDIIVSGDGFITPNTSYAPEELVPGEAHDAIGISVYTKISEGAPIIYNGTVDIFSSTNIIVPLSFMPPSSANIFVTFNNKNYEYTESTFDIINSEVQDLELFSIDWANNNLVVGRQSKTGKLGYVIVGIGGGRSTAEVGVLDSGSISTTEERQAEIVSLYTTATVKSAYVTLNGIAIPQITTANTATPGFIIEESDVIPGRAAAKVYGLFPIGQNSLQAYFFGTTEKYFNEFIDQIFTVGASPESTFILNRPPGNIEPFAGNIIVEFNNGSGWRRLQPPFISYYRVSQGVYTYKIDNNITRPAGSFAFNDIRVYLNGIQGSLGDLYTFDFATQTITLNSNLVGDGDVLAILGIPSSGGPACEFDIQENTLTLLSPVTDAQLRVITFNNHDDMLVRTESFQGSPNRRFKVSRNIININYVWVTVNGIMLVNKIDYTVLDDGRTIELSDKWYTTENDLVVITSISSEKLVDNVLGYRIFKDIFQRSHYKRISKRNSTVLTKDFYFTDIEIHVADSSVLMPPLISKKVPGVVLIDGERIEYFEIDGNVLKQLRRATLGTGPSVVLPRGTKVLDQSATQTIPYTDRTLRQVFLTTSTTNTYMISAISTITEINVGNDQLRSDGIILATTSTINPIDQVEVYYGGRKLRKHGIYYHDNSISYDSIDVDVIGTTATVELLPITEILNTAYLVTSTNQVWVYTGSIDVNAVNGYVYQGLNYSPPEFSISVSLNTQTAVVYAFTATMIRLGIIPLDLSYDLNGDGVVNSADSFRYSQLAYNIYDPAYINYNSNYGELLEQQLILNIADGIQDNVRCEIIKRDFYVDDIWNDRINNNTTKSLFESSSAQAKFISQNPAELPTDSFYGGRSALQVSNGLPLTDNDNNLLEGL